MQKSLLFELANPLIKQIYKLTLNYPSKYQSSLGDQLRRASLSVVLNIVEGGAKESIKEKRRYRMTAYSSLKETKYLIYFSKDMELISDEEYKVVMNETNRLAGILYGLLYKT